MDVVSLVLLFIVVVTVVAIGYWFATKTGVWAKLPEPLKYVAYAVVAIVCILLVANLAGFGPPLVRVR